MLTLTCLYSAQIVWPEEWDEEHPDFENTPTFLLTIDGIHCRCYEKDSSWYSHKFKQAGVNYELGVNVYENKLVWIKGPDKAATHDITVYRKDLKKKIPKGKRVIADGGYKGEPKTISFPNAHDSKDLAKFKSRARCRHETFNGRLKTFGCLEQRFRHKIQKHVICFEAVCVIVQYQLDYGFPLFDV